MEVVNAIISSTIRLWQIPELLAVVADQSDLCTLKSLRLVNSCCNVGARSAWRLVLRSMKMSLDTKSIFSTRCKVVNNKFVRDSVRELVITFPVNGVNALAIISNQEYMIEIFSGLTYCRTVALKDPSRENLSFDILQTKAGSFLSRCLGAFNQLDFLDQEPGILQIDDRAQFKADARQWRFMETYIEITLGHRPVECHYQRHLKLASLLIYITDLEYLSYNLMYCCHEDQCKLDPALIQTIQEPKHFTLYMENSGQPLRRLLGNWPRTNELVMSIGIEDLSVISELREILASNENALERLKYINIELRLKERYFEWSAIFESHIDWETRHLDLDVGLQNLARRIGEELHLQAT